MKAVLRNNFDGAKSPFCTTVEYHRSEGNFYFGFDCENSKFYAPYDEDNAPLWKGDVAEVFLRTGDDPNVYYEIEVAPNGAVFFGLIRLVDGHPECTFLPRPASVGVKRDKSGYKVFFTLTEKDVGKAAGDVYFNAFRIETEGGTPEAHLLALAPTMCGLFHKPEYFIKM